MLEHLRFLNGSDVGERRTGSPGFAAAAAYASAQLHGLQPGMAGSHLIQYRSPVHTIRSAALGSAVEGVDFLPDARSDSGQVAIESVAFATGALSESGTQVDAVVAADGKMADADFLTLAARGVRAVILVRALDARPVARAKGGMLVVQVTPAAAENLFHLESASGLNEVYRLPEPIILNVDAQQNAEARATNVFGFLAGKHPTLSSELVLVCADLDGPGSLGIGAAALLEVAQRYRLFSAVHQFPQRTLLFGIFSGARHGNAGLEDYLELPLWPLEKTRAVLYVGVEPGNRAGIRMMLESVGLEVRFMETPPEPRADSRTGPILRVAAEDGLRMAERTHALLRSLAQPLRRPQ